MRNKQWPNDLPIQVFVLAKNHKIHQAFCLEELAVFPYQLEKIWGKLLFSGLGEPPMVLESETQLIEKIKNTPGAIGYVSHLPPESGVRVMSIDRRDD